MNILNLTLFVFTVALILLFFGGTRQSFSSDDLSTLPASDTPVIVELFTSQGCSSCPPADRVIETLRERENLYILSCHVTYWDYIGWKDTLGSSACDDRQRQYAYALGQGRVYTPQMIVNGTQDLVGSRSKQVVQAISQAQTADTKIISVRSDEQAFVIDLPDLGASKAHTLRAFLIRKDVVTPIGRGENRNRTVTYVQNVTDMYMIGSWAGNAETRSVPIPPHRLRTAQADEIIILANEERFGTASAVGRFGL